MRVPQTVALIAGPTASGKSALALALAERTGGVVINADASQVYRDLRILSARPAPEEEARAAHRLFGHRDGADPCSAAAWAAEARAAIGEAGAAGRLPILVGGSGLYLRTLLDGIAPVPPIDPAVRDAVRAMPVGEAHAALAREDPAAAARLRPADTTRIARALEVVRATGRTIADWQRDRSGGIAGEVRLVPAILLPARDRLRRRIADRFGAMLAAGAAEEVRRLLGRGLDPALPVMRAIGVREIGDALAGRCSEEAAMLAAITATRHYAKRQQTWFSRQIPSWWTVYAQYDDDRARSIVTELRDQALTP